MHRAFLFLLLLVPIVGMASAAGLLSASAADDAWRHYLRSETAIAPDFTFPHSRCFRAAARSHGLPETLLLAMARGESDFDPDARSKANAHGVMQIQWPGTAKHLGIHRLSALYDPCTNIDAGARYIKELLSRYDNNLHLALAAYNYGPSRIQPGATRIPEGAAWYSAYIYRHLDYVLGDRQNETAGPSLYSELGRSVLLSFGEPYRAAAFVEGIEAQLTNGDVRPQIDWFRKGVGQFDVVYSYAGKEDFEAGAVLLRQAGFVLR